MVHSAPSPEPSPRSIRAALLPEDVGTFDSEYRQVMAEAIETLDLKRWRRIAWSSADPVAHHRMLRNAARLEAGQDVPTESWTTTRARLGLQ
jgi:hypothetical protein